MKVLSHILAIVVGALAAEGFTRATIEPDAIFEIAFSPGAQSYDDELGMVYTPNFDGYMRHPDGVWAEPIHLDENGFRPFTRTGPDLPGDPTRVAIISGRSMTMCYGLPDEKTIQSFMVKEAKRALEVHNTGWAGIDPYRAWHFFLRTLDKGDPFDVALFAINPGSFAPYATLPAGFEHVPRHPDADRFFYMMPGNIRMPKDALEDWMGPNYFRSYVLYGLLRYRQFPLEWWADAKRWVAKLRGEERAPAAEPVEDPAEIELGKRRFAEFFLHMQRHFAKRGTRFGVVFLVSFKHPVDCYDDFAAAMPPGVPFIDLQKRLRPEMDPRNAVALGHYGERQSRLVAEALNEFVDELLDMPVPEEGDE
ncbi:MAG TPA: hypothetical protein ENJ09_14565 [Planctomycetes bacterium]|nr:hypothetical protein [Planctomycetota bacterium]